MLLLGNEMQAELLKGGSHCSTSYLLVHLKHEQLSIDGLSSLKAAYAVRKIVNRETPTEESRPWSAHRLW